MFNNLDNNIITKSQLHEKLIFNACPDDIFAKTLSYSGIKNEFHIDIPEILIYEKELLERKADIEKFTNLVISDLDNMSHNELVMDIYKDGFVGSEYEQSVLSELAVNQRLLEDLR